MCIRDRRKYAPPAVLERPRAEDLPPTNLATTIKNDDGVKTCDVKSYDSRSVTLAQENKVTADRFSRQRKATGARAPPRRRPFRSQPRQSRRAGRHPDRQGTAQPSASPSAAPPYGKRCSRSFRHWPRWRDERRRRAAAYYPVTAALTGRVFQRHGCRSRAGRARRRHAPPRVVATDGQAGIRPRRLNLDPRSENYTLKSWFEVPSATATARPLARASTCTAPACTS